LNPVSFTTKKNHDSILKPKVVCQYLLEKMKCAGVTNVYFILRNGNWDIPSYLTRIRNSHMHIAYVVVDETSGVPYTLDSTYNFVRNSIVVYGFPDIIFSSRNANRKLLLKQVQTGADIVLGLYLVDRPEKWDMVGFDQEARINRILIKPLRSRLKYAWTIAVWTPVFTQFLHEYIENLDKNSRVKGNYKSERNTELFIGEVIFEAIKEKLRVDYIIFSNDICLDIGTPSGLVKATKLEARTTLGTLI
jgi:glucose-1-phosphate thymidylyltransferase